MINLKHLPNDNMALYIIIVVMIVIGAPIAFIWALNTLFPVLAIPYTIETWIAAIIIPSALKASISTTTDKDK